MVFSAIAVGRYTLQVRAVINLDELTKGCMDEYTTIPDVVFENVVVYTADQGKRYGFAVLSFSVVLVIKVFVCAYTLHKMGAYQKFKKNCKDKATTSQSGTQEPSSRYQLENWLTPLLLTYLTYLLTKDL